MNSVENTENGDVRLDVWKERKILQRVQQLQRQRVSAKSRNLCSLEQMYWSSIDGDNSDKEWKSKFNVFCTVGINAR